MPLPVETLGGWHVDAITQLRRLSQSAARRSTSDERTAERHLFQRLAVALQRGNATLMASRETDFPDRRVDGQ